MNFRAAGSCARAGTAKARIASPVLSELHLTYERRGSEAGGGFGGTEMALDQGLSKPGLRAGAGVLLCGRHGAPTACLQIDGEVTVTGRQGGMRPCPRPASDCAPEAHERGILTAALPDQPGPFARGRKTSV